MQQTPSISELILSRNSRSLSMIELIEALGERLNAVDVPVWRIATSLRTLHPEIFVQNLMWMQGCTTHVELRPHEMIEQVMYFESPIAKLHRFEADEIRCRLQGADADLGYNICREIASEGGTDYIIFALDYSDGQRTFLSFATNQVAGFIPQHLDALRELVPVLALRNELAARRFATDCLLRVYLGPNAAQKVISGQFHRGDAETLPAVIWFSDMRGFTALSNRVDPDALICILDRFFDKIVEPITAAGGEVLKFIGDAVLAIFPFQEGAPRSACEQALAAAHKALAGVAELARELPAAPDLAMGIGLHLGELTYGNVGSKGRLDFTVIGASVNEASRVEGLCKQLSEPLLLTAPFAKAIGNQDLRSLGLYELRGVPAPMNLFAPGR